MSAPDSFALGGFGSGATSARRNELAERRSELEASPQLRKAAEELASAILRAIPDYDLEKSFLPRWPDDDEAGQDGGAT
jgi:hypothetical protein